MSGRRPRHPSSGRGSAGGHRTFGSSGHHNSGNNGSPANGANSGREQADVRLCKNFLLGGDSGCHFGSNCKFAHVLQRVADVVPPQQTGNLAAGAVRLSEVKAVASSIDAQGNPQIYTGSKDGVVRQWNLENWTADRPIQLLGEVGCVAAAHPFLACGYEGATTIPNVPVGLARVWNVQTGQEIDLGVGDDGQAVPTPTAPGGAPPTAHRQRVACVALRARPAESILEVYTGGLEGNIHFWQLHVASGQVRLGQRLEGHVRGVLALQLFPHVSPNALLSASADHTVRLWNLDSEAAKSCSGALSANENGHTDAVTSLTAFALDNSAYFATGSRDRALKVWDTNGKLQVSANTHAPVLALDTASAGPAGQPIVVVGLEDGTVELRQPNPNLMLRASILAIQGSGPHRAPQSNLAGHAGAVHDLICSVNFFCSAAADGHLMVWQWKQPLPPPQH